MTITAYAYSQDGPDCSGGTFDVEIWETQSRLVDEPYVFLVDLASGLTGEVDNNDNLNIDVDGENYLI